MKLLVLSDLHIHDAEDPLYSSLLHVLGSTAEKDDIVVLAGDVFDLFVGGKDVFLERYSAFFALLKALTQRGVKVHYIEGNHDFLLKGTFQAVGVPLHEAEVKLKLGDRAVYIAHGDLVDRSDWGYRFVRWFYRAWFFRLFVRFSPGWFIDWLGKQLSRQSRNRKPLLPTELPIERRERLRKVYRSFAAERIAEGHDFVVLGHCHDLDEMEFQVAGRRGHYANMGYPRAHGSYLVWQPGDKKLQRTALPAASENLINWPP